MKKVLSFFAQFLLFLAAFAGGILIGVFDPLHLKWFVTHPTPTSTRYFVPDGILLMLLLYLLILLIHTSRKAVRTSGLLTSVAFALAAICGLLAKFGFVNTDSF